MSDLVNASEVYAPADPGKRKIQGNFKGNTMVVDPDTGFLDLSKNWGMRGFTPNKKLEFLTLLKDDPTVEAACKGIGICYATFINHYRKDTEFKKAADFAIEEGRRKHKGEFESKMLQYGKEKSGFLWAMAWLRKTYPNEYSDKKQVEHTMSKDVLDRLDKRMENYKIIE